MKPQIAKRSYELYEQRGHKDGHAVQDWESAEKEIQKSETKVKPEDKVEIKSDSKTDTKLKTEPTPGAKVEVKPEAKDETKPETKPELKPEDKAEANPDAKVKATSDLTPGMVKRVHELYEELGRRDLRAVEDMEKAKNENQKNEPDK